MTDDPVYKLIDLTGTSSVSMEDAIQNAVAKASKTVRNMRWFEVTEIRGAIRDTEGEESPNAEVFSWQVSVKIGFKVDDE